MPAPRVLCIAGTDPSGGAGLLADLKSVAANGGYGMGAVTALTAQNTLGVRGVHVPPADFLAEQLYAVSDDITIDAVKIGMLGTAEVAAVVGQWLDAIRPPVVVLDPVMVATSGDRLLAPDAEAGVQQLFERVHLVTPNGPELAVLAGTEPALTGAELVEQALTVSARHRVLVLAKGGHLGGDSSPDQLVDAAGGRLSGGRTVVEFPGPRVLTSQHPRHRLRPLLGPGHASAAERGLGRGHDPGQAMADRGYPARRRARGRPRPRPGASLRNPLAVPRPLAPAAAAPTPALSQELTCTFAPSAVHRLQRVYRNRNERAREFLRGERSDRGTGSGRPRTPGRVCRCASCRPRS